MEGPMSQDTQYLHAEVLQELRRLHGHIPEDFEPRDWTVSTPAGEHAIPAPVQALLAVTWPPGQSLRTDDPYDWEVRLPAHQQTGPGLIAEDRAWYTVGYDEGQWYLVVDLAEAATTDDPRIYRVDHEGGEPAPKGIELSYTLSDLRRSTPAIELGRACGRGDANAVRDALDAGMGTGPLDATGLTPLHLAVISGSLETVTTVIDAGGDPDSPLAANLDSDEVWKTYFGDTGADPSRCSCYLGDRPLHVALGNLRDERTRETALDIIKTLVATGADVHAERSDLMTEGWNPADTVYDMTLGVYSDGPEVRECLAFLYEAGAQLDAYGFGE
jgi:hypothetical protein